MSGQRLIGAHLPTTHPERGETRPGRCSGGLTRFVVDVRLPWPSRCPDCGGSVVSEGEVEPVARRLPFEGPRRQRRSRGAPLGGSAAASGLGPRWCGPGRDARRSTRCGSGRLSRIKSVRAGRWCVPADVAGPRNGSASSRSRCCDRPAADVRRCRACSAAAARSTACRDLVVVEGNLLCGETRGPGPGLAAGQCPAVRTAKGRTVRDHDPLQNCRSSKATREEVTVDEPQARNGSSASG